jgi:hypothetical protein
MAGQSKLGDIKTKIDAVRRVVHGGCGSLGVELCLVVRARRLRRLRQLFEQTPARPGDDPAASRRALRPFEETNDQSRGR